MKKLLTAALALIMVTACTGGKPSSETVDETVTITNTVELESTESDMSGYVWLDTTEKNVFQTISLKDSVRIFKEGGSAILYYGKVDCPWCQRAVPLLSQAAIIRDVTVYYVDVSQKVEKADYDELVTYIESTFQLNNGKPSFFVPEVIAVKNGQIVDSHVSLVESFTLTSDEDMLTEEQSAELLEIYKTMIKKAAD